MTEMDFEKLFISKDSHKALKKAARCKDRVIRSQPDSLSTSTRLCQWTNQVSDGMGGVINSPDSRLIINDDGIRYVKWRRRQSSKEMWNKIKKSCAFLIPTAIALAALIHSIMTS